MSFDPSYFLDFIHPSPAMLGAAAIVIYVAVIAQLMGVVLGVLSALGGMSKLWPLRTISGLYVWFFRGTPVLVQIYLIYLGTPSLLGGLDLFPYHMHIGPLDLNGAVVAGTLALGINEGAYMSEIVRAGILSVDPGQTEAAKSLGMTYRLTMSRIVLPQALRVIVPPLGNEFNNMLKTTSLLAVISVGELLAQAQASYSSSFKQFEPLLGICVYYLLLTTVWSWIQSRIETRLARGAAGSPVEIETRGWRDRLIGFRYGSPSGGGGGGIGGH